MNFSALLWNGDKLWYIVLPTGDHLKTFTDYPFRVKHEIWH